MLEIRPRADEDDARREEELKGDWVNTGGQEEKEKNKKKKNNNGNCLGERDGVVLSGDGWTRHETGTALGSKRCGLMGMHRHSHALSEMGL